MKLKVKNSYIVFLNIHIINYHALTFKLMSLWSPYAPLHSFASVLFMLDFRILLSCFFVKL